MIILISDSEGKLDLEYNVQTSSELKAAFKKSALFYRKENISEHNSNMKHVLDKLANKSIDSAAELKRIRKSIMKNEKKKGTFFLDESLDIFVSQGADSWCGPVSVVYLTMIEAINWKNIYAELQLNLELSEELL